MQEIWKDIKDYEGIYQVSNMGNIKRLKGKGVLEERILKPANCKGYQKVSLNKNGKAMNIGIHRLVALTFIPNPNNYKIVNHMDENKANNRFDNLEWCTQFYNCNYDKTKNNYDYGVEKEDNSYRRVRLSKGLTIPALSRASNVPIRTIESIERYDNCFVDTAIKLAAALNVTMDELCIEKKTV